MSQLETLHHWSDINVLEIPSDGPTIATEGDASRLLSAGWDVAAALIALPVARLSPEFFELSSGMAGAIAQKFVNYKMRLAIVGDVATQAARNTAFSDFIREANEGEMVWFVPDLEVLKARLAERI